MSDTYTIKINRRDGAIEASGDKEWVEEKLAQFADVFSEPLVDPPGKERVRGPARASGKRASKKDTNGAKKPTRRRTGSPARVKGLDLAPHGKQSFAEFVAEKQPANKDDQNVASVYYLTEIAEISPVTVDHVFTCYRERGWDLPVDLKNSLQVTASRKGFIDTADMDEITLEPIGLNYVERSLPAKSSG
ncbi:MAG TPA: hypothetical protein VM690_01505 [Gaiellaceae bacterium]|nr:hypothetical protein [Gaiellaceae bacterium]